MTHRALAAGLLALCGWVQAAPVTLVTKDSTAVREFQKGLTVEDFETVKDIVAQPLTAYTGGLDVDAKATVYAEVSDGARSLLFTVGGTPAVNMPALFRLDGTLAGDAHSGQTVMGHLDLDGKTNFGDGGLIEAFLPSKVSSLGFWLNPSLGDAVVTFLNTNYVFSREDEVILGRVVVKAGEFVGLSLDRAEIGGLKIGAVADDRQVIRGFTIDDLSYGSAAPPNNVPEPGGALLALGGLVSLAGVRRSRRAAGR